MIWTPTSLIPIAELSYIRKSSEILEDVDETYPLSKLWIRTGSDTLLICMGEEWTYSQGLPPTQYDPWRSDDVEKIGTVKVENYWPGKMARFLHNDLIAYSVPGSTNQSRLDYLRQLLLETDLSEYSNIRVVFIVDTEVDEQNTLKFLDAFTKGGLNLEIAVCKKFGSFENFNYNLKFVPLSFVDWAGRIHGVSVTDVNRFMKTQNELSQSYTGIINQIGHFLWAVYLSKKAGWKTL